MLFSNVWIGIGFSFSSILISASRISITRSSAGPPFCMVEMEFAKLLAGGRIWKNIAKKTKNSSGERLWFSMICFPPYHVIMRKVIEPKNSLIGEASSLFLPTPTAAFSHLLIEVVKRLFSNLSALKILITFADFRVSSTIEKIFPISVWASWACFFRLFPISAIRVPITGKTNKVKNVSSGLR